MTDEQAKALRSRMIARIEAEMGLTARLTGRARLSPPVLAALAQVPRHLFVPGRFSAMAYEDTPLPIGRGQTISQPFMVALMTELLDVEPGSRVLEIGTGSGYQAAVLAHLAAEVCTIEVIDELSAAAAERLRGLGLANVHLRAGDGRQGWPERAPFDRILVTAAADELPPALADQLVDGGILLAPLGPAPFVQELVLHRKIGGALHECNLLPVAFVPLVGRQAR